MMESIKNVMENIENLRTLVPQSVMRMPGKAGRKNCASSTTSSLILTTTGPGVAQWQEHFVRR